MAENEAFENHTGAGKLLVLATACFAIAAFGLAISEGTAILPSGMYPAVLFACAIAPVALVFYLTGALLLRLLGIPIHKPGADE